MNTLNHHRLTLARLRHEFALGKSVEESLAIARSLFDRQALADRLVGEDRSRQTSVEISVATLPNLQ